MQMIFVVYEGMTALDAVGPYEILSRLPGARVTFAGVHAGPVRTDTGALSLVAERALADCEAPDLVLVPGGPDVAAQTSDTALHDWLRAVDPVTTWTTSVCTGSLILAAAGLLRGRTATSHWLALDRLPAYDVTPSPRRVVRDGKYVTGAGVSAGIDLALTLADIIAGPAVAQTIQLATEYDPQPPFTAGSPASAPPELVSHLRANAHLVMST
ncbi:DJ-1/PfpI family protein [Dactylosporangium siamense]|uniref:Glutamine amidotransferase n=1 Tax=Dactylosporangium siamense TaxID=685454 RepID=A0A919PJ33_9ACTN|nr:DJ-1/PfpI family protein [Dactylosporangium siamense]GIG44629.1 glutamine amidotransferase [Dactylosporangium siamense]